MLAVPAGTERCGIIWQLPLPCLSWRIHWFPAVHTGTVAVTGKCCPDPTPGTPCDVQGHGVPTSAHRGRSSVLGAQAEQPPATESNAGL